MFTGIVEEVGHVVSFDSNRLKIRAGRVLDDVRVSDSILVAGACLTVVERDQQTIGVDIVPETLGRTNLGDLIAGDGVNLEKALVWGGRVGGHLVQGHIDGIGKVSKISPDQNSQLIVIQSTERIIGYVVEKGFIAVDGISLTVVNVCESSFSFAVIPFTLQHTTLGTRAPGDLVNLETDITAKYLERLIQPQTSSSS